MTDIQTRFAGLAFAATLATATITLTASPVHAAEPVYPTARIAHADLNLGSDAGVSALNSRIRNVAERLCAHKGFSVIDKKKLEEACIDAAIASTHRQVDEAIARKQDSRLAARTAILGR